jgi:hypothetical protein
MSQAGPLPEHEAVAGVARCVVRSVLMLIRHEVHQPREHVGRELTFADGTSGLVYRESRVGHVPADPCVLVVAFRLRLVRGRGHAVFERESVLNTPLFVGFPGFVSKLWLGHDERGVYRGVYEWDGPAAAERYARSLWRVLELVSRRGSIDYRVVPGLTRDAVLADPGLLDGVDSEEAWWRLVTA